MCSFKVDKVNLHMARRGWGPGRQFCGLADRWYLRLLLSLTTGTESSTVHSTNVGAVGRSKV